MREGEESCLALVVVAEDLDLQALADELGVHAATVAATEPRSLCKCVRFRRRYSLPGTCFVMVFKTGFLKRKQDVGCTFISLAMQLWLLVDR